LVLIGLEEKDQQKQKTKQNKTKQNKTKTKKKTTTKQFDHFIFKICQNQYFTLA
jgi:hypothetical protein